VPKTKTIIAKRHRWGSILVCRGCGKKRVEESSAQLLLKGEKDLGGGEETGGEVKQQHGIGEKRYALLTRR